jgi:hypothetical protein
VKNKRPFFLLRADVVPASVTAAATTATTAVVSTGAVSTGASVASSLGGAGIGVAGNLVVKNPRADVTLLTKDVAYGLMRGVRRRKRGGLKREYNERLSARMSSLVHVKKFQP